MRITDDKRESDFLDSNACQWQFNDTTQLPFRALSPAQPLRTTSSRSSISFAFSFAFNPRYLYYRG